MTAPHAGVTHVSGRATVSTRGGVRRVRGAAPLARPVLGGPAAAPVNRRVVGGSGVAAASCRVVSPAARREGLLLKLKVVAVTLVALAGVGVSAAEFTSWTEPDPAVDYVAGDPAWAHVTDR